MNLAKFSRRRYTSHVTPIERMDNLSDHFKGPQLYVKRDDSLGLTEGGNKTRKLEFLVADAINCGADTNAGGIGVAHNGNLTNAIT